MVMKVAPLLFGALVFASLGCGKEEATGPNTPMGDSAPAFTSDMKSFLVGTWSPIEDGAVNLNKKWVFAADGTFIFHTEDPWRAAGKWDVVENQVSLQYLTLDGLSWADAQAKVQQEESGGSQAAIATALGMRWVFEDLPKMMRLILDDDKKHMKFSNQVEEDPPADDSGQNPGGVSDPNLPDVQGLSLDDFFTVQIERLK